MTIFLKCGLSDYLQQRLQYAAARHNKGVLLNPNEVEQVWELAKKVAAHERGEK